ncbi:MAG: MFS transporter [Planctomycetota bacterium]
MTRPPILAFVLQERRFLALGFLLTLVSSFGQTFFISLSSDRLMAAFDLTNGRLGLIYSLATLTSGLLILQVGRIVDAVDLRWVVAGVLAGLGLAAGVVATAPVAAMLGLGFLGLRLCGQGLCGHVAMTVMARTYGRRRGLAMSLAAAGHAAGEAALPIATVWLLEQMGWRLTWAIVAGGLVALVLPLASWLLRAAPAERMRPPVTMDRPDPGGDGDGGGDGGGPAAGPDWTRGQVLRDRRFLLLLPAVLAPGTLITGVFFHQVHLAEVRGWSMNLMALSFIAFSATQVPAGLLAGQLIDRIGAVRVLPGYLLPMAAGLAVLAAIDHPAAAFVFMGLTGVTAAIAGPVTGAAWVELYGVRHLGAIRSMAMSASVLGTAATPVAAGWLLDAGIRPSPMLAAAAIAATLAGGLAWATLRWRGPGTPPPAPPPLDAAAPRGDA